MTHYRPIMTYPDEPNFHRDGPLSPTFQEAQLWLEDGVVQFYGLRDGFLWTDAALTIDGRSYGRVERVEGQ